MSPLSLMLGMLAMLAASTASVATRAAVQRAATGPRLEIECNSNYPGRDIAADLVHYSRDYTSIEFLNCDLTTLDFGFLAEFPALDALYVEGGSLEEFHGMPTLPVLTWAQIAVPNFRTFWGPGLTPSLGCLILEMISDDAAIDNILTSALFYKESIWLLYLSRSGATRIPPLAIEFPDLNIFDYNFNNQTRRLTAGTFPSTFRPGAIFVDDCNITEIEPGTFEGDFFGRVLYLRGSALESLSESVFGSVLRSMAAGGDGELYLGTVGNCDCGLSWIYRDSPELLRFIMEGQCYLSPSLDGWVNLSDVPSSLFTNCPT